MGRVLLFGLISRHRGRNRGGTAVSMARLANGFARRGLEVTVLTAPRAEGRSLPEDLDPEVQTVFLASRRRLSVGLELVRALRRLRPEAVLAFDTRANLLAARALLWGTKGTRLWLNWHNSLIRQMDGWPAARRRRRIRQLRAACGRAAGVVTISRGLARDVAELGIAAAGQVHTVPPPVVTERLFLQARQDPPHPWFEPGRPPVVLGVGRLVRQKDFATLVRAFALVRRHLPCRLVILGEGPQRAELEALAASLGVGEDVRLPGFVSNPYGAMQRAAVLASSSLWEGLSMVLIEAMALGLPVVSTDCPHGPGEVLGQGQWGRLVPVGNATALAEAIGETLAAPPDRDDLRRAVGPYAAERVMDRYLRLLE